MLEFVSRILERVEDGAINRRQAEVEIENMGIDLTPSLKALIDNAEQFYWYEYPAGTGNV